LKAIKGNSFNYRFLVNFYIRYLGEWIPFEKYEMKVGPKGDDFVFFPWPKVVEHIIDEESPLYEICKEHIDSKPNSSSESFSNNSDDSERKNKHINHNYEIVVILEGKIETTGASCHIRTSYLPQEIHFGFRFTPVFQEFSNYEYFFDYSKFDEIEAVDKELFYLNEKDINCYQNLITG
jgi:potassium inwardly-rectifying channel subfamily J protein 1